MKSDIKKFLFKIAYPLALIYWGIFKPKTCGSRAIILRDENILLVRQIGAPHWSLPGGGIEKGETPEQNIRRELKEELGLEIENVEYKLGEYIANHEGKRDTVHIFIVKTSEERIQKQWELDDAKWFLLVALPENLSPATTRRIAEFKEGKRNVIGKW